MTVPFQSTNSTIRLAYTTTPGNTTVASAQILNVVNTDTANVVYVAAGYANTVANATTGVGSVVGPMSTAQLKFNTTGASGNIYISVVGGSSSGNVYITPGSL